MVVSVSQTQVRFLPRPLVMEIRINKEAQERQQREELNRVIVRAKTYANAGVELFDFKRQKAIGLSPFELIQRVEKETNGTVFCEVGFKATLQKFCDTITFTIKK